MSLLYHRYVSHLCGLFKNIKIFEAHTLLELYSSSSEGSFAKAHSVQIFRTSFQTPILLTCNALCFGSPRVSDW